MWNAAMREEVLAKLEAARADPSAAPPAASFRFKALEACPSFVTSVLGVCKGLQISFNPLLRTSAANVKRDLEIKPGVSQAAPQLVAQTVGIATARCSQGPVHTAAAALACLSRATWLFAQHAHVPYFNPAVDPVS